MRNRRDKLLEVGILLKGLDGLLKIAGALNYLTIGFMVYQISEYLNCGMSSPASG